MRKEVVVLSEAASDIEQGIDFYDLIEEDLGSYFRDSIITDLRRLGLYFGTPKSILASFGCSRPDLHSPFITATKKVFDESLRFRSTEKPEMDSRSARFPVITEPVASPPHLRLLGPKQPSILLDSNPAAAQETEGTESGQQ